MRKLSPTKAIAHAFNSVASYRHIALRIGAFWVPVLLVLAFLQSFVAPVNPEAPELGPGVFLEIASGIIGFLAFCSMAVSWHRFILRDELGSPSRIDRDVIRYAGNSLLIMLIGAVPLGLFAGILTVFLPPLSFLVLPAAIAAALSSSACRSSFRPSRWAAPISPSRMPGRERRQYAAADRRVPAECGDRLRGHLRGDPHRHDAPPHQRRGCGHRGLLLGAVLQLFYTLFNASTFTSLYGFFVERRDF